MLFFLFLASFFNVFLLGLSSQFVRDQRVALCFTVSWFISASQFIYTRVTSGTESPLLAFIVSGFGGSMGIVASIYFYRWFQPWYQLRTKRKSQ
jgi:hypothetical protein